MWRKKSAYNKKDWSIQLKKYLYFIYEKARLSLKQLTCQLEAYFLYQWENYFLRLYYCTFHSNVYLTLYINMTIFFVSY